MTPSRSPLEILRISHEVERAQVAELAVRRLAQDEIAVELALRAMVEAAATDANLVPFARSGRPGMRRPSARFAEPCARSGESTGEPARI